MTHHDIESKVGLIVKFLGEKFGFKLEEEPTVPPVVTKPTEGIVKQGGWGANNDPKKWGIVNMKDRPTLYKVIDETGKNVATDFSTSIIAQQYIDYYKANPPTTTPPVVEPPGPVIPPVTPVEGQDQFGIIKIAKDAPNGKNITDMSYKRSSHNTGTRDTFSKKGADFMNMECTGYYKTSLSDNEEELSYKIWGGTHSDSAPAQGQCISFGMEQVGTPSFKKEYPKHPTTPDFSNDVTIAPGMPKKLQSFKGRWIGLKGVAWIDKAAKKAFFRMYVDDKGMINGKPANDWKLWYTHYDDGSNLKGPAFMENMGVKNGGDGIFYMRIDTVTDKTETYGISCREIIPPVA